MQEIWCFGRESFRVHVTHVLCHVLRLLCLLCLVLRGKQEVRSSLFHSLSPSPRSVGHIHSIMLTSYEKHFPKNVKDVGMAVPKTTETRYRDGIMPP